jgi:Tetrapyrrole (Corrin/Porphyrin) Methylases
MDQSCVDSYPSPEEHVRRWEALAREIADCKQHLPENVDPSAPKGSLIVIGSGIQGVSFITGSEALIRTADKVFYTVSNPPTHVWLHTLRPDAFDLYVLYDDTKPRYHTYVQMSEAILHYVRKGKRVVVVFYGHPGIFVFSTHRSIAIARREGHFAEMKPGISALDCLCADLGVDPAYPGMQTFEATELLIRRRHLDITSHVVLWQVGLIGDTGYRRKGFINDKFPILVEYLLNFYGPDHEVTHYIAARFPTFPATMAVHKISALLEPRVRATITAISTFYIAPKEAAPTDGEMVVRLGLLKPGQRPVDPPPLRDIALYRPREAAALEEFGHFQVPKEYQLQKKTRASEFLIELGENIELQDLYRDSPEKAVSEDVFPGLSAQEKHLLAAHTEGFAQVAAKGMLVPPSPNERFVMDLQTQTDLARDLRAHLASDLRQTNAKGKINEWISSRGYRATLAGIPEAIERVNDSSLLPWTGVYATPDLGFVLTVIGSPHRNSWSAIYANQVPIKAFTFNNATLTWLATEGNPHSAELNFRMPSSNGTSEFRRALSGKFWDAGANEPAAANLEAREVAPAYSPLSVWTGRYQTRVAADGATEGPEIAVVSPRPDQSPNVSHLTIDGKKVDSAVFERGALQWQGNRIEFTQSDGEKRLSGVLDGVNLEGALVPDDDAAFEGRYNAYLWSGSRWAPCGAFSYESEAVHIGRHAVEGARFDRNMLRWEASVEDRSNGSLQFFIDPTTQLPKFVGSMWTSGAKPEYPNLLGVRELTTTAGVEPPTPVGGGGLSPAVWTTLGAIGLEGLNPECHFLWSRWQRARFTCRVTNSLLKKACAAVAHK